MSLLIHDLEDLNSQQTTCKFVAYSKGPDPFPTASPLFFVQDPLFDLKFLEFFASIQRLFLNGVICGKFPQISCKNDSSDYQIVL